MSENFQNDVTKAVNCQVNLGESVLEAYMLLSSEKRLGVENIGATLGYSDSFFFELTEWGSETLKTLREMGFSGEIVWANVVNKGNDQTGSFLIKTLGIRDFVKLITYEASKGNLKATILLAAFAETGLERILEDAFAGRSIDFLLEKIVHYSKWTYEERQEVFAYNREEVRALRMGSSAFT